MNAMALPIALMLVAMLVEIVLLRCLKAEPTPWLDVIFNLNSGHLVLWFFRGLEIGAYAWVLNHVNLQWTEDWSPWAIWLFAFLAWDLCFYWLHRLHHKIEWLWAVHVVHHQGEHFNLSLGIRNSWYSSLTSFPFFAILAVLGIPLKVFVAVSSLHYAVQFYNHNGLVKSSGLLERFMVTPCHHRVHHGANPVYIDRNFGGTFVVWDKLFGTFQRALPDVSIVYGTPGWQRTYNPFWASQVPLLRRLGLKQPRLPLSNLDAAQVRWVVSGGLILFGLVIYYVACESNILTGAQQYWLFALLSSCAIALGGLSDGRYWAHAAWSVLAFTVPVLLVGLLKFQDPLGCGLMFLLGLHAIAIFWWHQCRSNRSFSGGAD